MSQGVTQIVREDSAHTEASLDAEAAAEVGTDAADVDADARDADGEVDGDAGSREVETPAIQPPEEADVAANALRRSERREKRASFAMVFLAVVAGLHVVYFGRTILMPVITAVLVALLFRPLVRRCRRYRIPDSLSAALILVAVLLTIVGAVANLVGPAQAWLKDAPEHLQTVGQKLHVLRDKVEDLNRASEMVEDLASGKAQSPEPPGAPFPFAPDPSDDERTNDPLTSDDSRGEGATSTSDPEKPIKKDPLQTEESQPEPDEPIAVEVQQPRLATGLTVLSSTGSVAGELLMMLVLAYFLLASGDMLINNVLHILPSMREKRNAVELVHNVEHGISAYLRTVTLINVGLGIAIGSAMWLLGVPNPALWGAMATVFNFVPYLGALCGTVVVFLVSVLSFDTLGEAIVPPLVYWGFTAVEGNLVTPQLIGRSMSLNPIMVFLMLAVWGWMWGIGGAFLAVPILAMLKVGFDQFERTKPLGTLLGGDSDG